MGITLKQSTPTIMNINLPYITLLDSIISTFTYMYSTSNMDILVLERRHQDSYNTRFVQIDEYRWRHITSNAGIHVPTKAQSTERHLVETSTAPTVLATTINIPHTTLSIYTKYDTWAPTISPSPVFLTTDAPTDIYRKYTNLRHVNRSTIRTLRQIKRQPINTIRRHYIYTINHDINISQLRHAC